MLTCPRCSTNNDSGRAACWNCYAPLQGAMASKVKPMVLVARPVVETVPAETAPVDDSGIPAPEPEPKKKRGLFGRK